MVKYKNIRSSIFLKLFIPTIATISVLGSSLSYISYHDQKDNMINDRIQASQLIASVATSVIDSNDVASIKTIEDTQKVVYNKILNQFEIINADGQLKDIYSIYFQDNDVYYGVVNSDTDDIATGSTVKHLSNKYHQLNNLSEDNILSDTTITYNDYNEPIISSFAPLLNADNELIGAIACEYDASVILQALHTLSFKLALITILSSLLTGFITTVIILAIMKKLNLISLKLEDMSSDGSDLTSELNVKSNDELGLFSNNINTFVKYIRKVFNNIKNHIKSIDTSVNDAYIGVSDADKNINETDTKLSFINISSSYPPNIDLFLYLTIAPIIT